MYYTSYYYYYGIPMSMLLTFKRLFKLEFKYICFQLSATPLSISLSDGNIRLHMITTSLTDLVKSLEGNFSDGGWYELSLQLSRNQIYIEG